MTMKFVTILLVIAATLAAPITPAIGWQDNCEAGQPCEPRPPPPEQRSGRTPEEREADREARRVWRLDREIRGLLKKGDAARERGRCTVADDYYRKAAGLSPSAEWTAYINQRLDLVWSCYSNARVWGGITIEFPEGAYIRTPNGKILRPQRLYRTLVPFGSTVVTGNPRNFVKILLPHNQSGITISGEVTLDEFIFDPNYGGIAKLAVGLLSGQIRFATFPNRRKPKNVSIDTAMATIGPRGTDVDVRADSKGNGYVDLYEGEVDVTEKATGRIITLKAGGWAKFENGRLVDFRYER